MTGSLKYQDHIQILARFLSEQGIPYRWNGTGNLIADHDELVLAGGGRFCLDALGETLRVWDDSNVYGRYDSARLALQLAAAGSPWNRLVLDVG